MFKVNFCAARVPRMTHAQYLRYARDNHARLVLDTKPVSQRLHSYVQQHVFDACYGAQAETARFDSVSHLTAPAIADHLAATSSPEYREIIAPDEKRFADGRSVLFAMLTETPMALPVRGASPHRLLHYGRAREGVERAVLQDHWIAAHARIVEGAPHLQRTLRRAVLNLALPGPQGAPPIDAMGEIGFLERSDVPVIGDYVAAMEAALAPWLDIDRSFFLLCDAVPVRGGWE